MTKEKTSETVATTERLWNANYIKVMTTNFLLYLVPGKIVGKLHPAVGLAQTRERLLKLKQLVTVVLGVVFHVDSC